MSRSTPKPVPRRRRLRVLALAAGAAVLLTGGLTALVMGTAQAAPSAASAATSTNDGNRAHDVLANLFEWNWPSVARECTNVLGRSASGATAGLAQAHLAR